MTEQEVFHHTEALSRQIAAYNNAEKLSAEDGLAVLAATVDLVIRRSSKVFRLDEKSVRDAFTEALNMTDDGSDDND